MLDVELLTSWDTVKSNFRKKAKQFHPDRPGGSHEKMTQLNVKNFVFFFFYDYFYQKKKNSNQDRRKRCVVIKIKIKQ